MLAEINYSANLEGLTQYEWMLKTIRMGVAQRAPLGPLQDEPDYRKGNSKAESVRQSVIELHAGIARALGTLEKKYEPHEKAEGSLETAVLAGGPPRAGSGRL